MMRLLTSVGFAVLLVSTNLSAQTKRIVTYIEDVQEERRSTRWTLTEWLRIKERMKLMDLWLAMFSDPAKNKFAPELSLSYQRSGGETTYDLGTPGGFAQDKKSSRDETIGEEAKPQFWFTNLVSGTTGLRTLDIDLGIEGKIQNRFADEILEQSVTGESWTAETAKLQQGGVNLQALWCELSGLDTRGESRAIHAGSRLTQIAERDGIYYGGELSLYFLSFLGVEGNYYQYLDGKKKLGESLDAFAFLEIYNVRLGYGQAQRSWEYESETSRLKIKEADRLVMLRLYF